MRWASYFDALKHCHERNVIHRDIKSGNILIKGREGSEDFDQKRFADFSRISQTACELYFPKQLITNRMILNRSLGKLRSVRSSTIRAAKPGYQAPEVLLGKYTPPAKKQGEIVNDDEVENSNDIVNNGKVSMETYAKVDIFAFGVAMYFLCKEKSSRTLQMPERIRRQNRSKASKCPRWN